MIYRKQPKFKSVKYQKITSFCKITKFKFLKFK